MRDPDLHFCPRCAGALAWRAFEYPGIEHPACVACGYVLWQNRKPSVEALITRAVGDSTEMLLGRRPDDGTWNLPGGFLNAQDLPEEALVRECKREMDVVVHVGEIVGAFPDLFHSIPIVSIVYLCRLASGTPCAADLVDAVGWFPVTAPPPLSFPADAAAVDALRRRLGSTAGSR